VAGTAGDDESVPVSEARLEGREVDALGEEPTLLAQVAHGVIGERLECLRHAAALLGEGGREVRCLPHPPGDETVAVPEDARAPHREQVAVAHRVEELRPGRVDQADASANEE
jgi:hypothetical protein